MATIIGLPVSEVFLTDPFKCYFPRVVVFARNTQSEKAARLSSRGAEVVHVDFTGQQDDMKRLISALDGIDILINVLGETKGHEKQILVDAAVSAGVKTYFPSEFGVYVSIFFNQCTCTINIADAKLTIVETTALTISLASTMKRGSKSESMLITQIQ